MIRHLYLSEGPLGPTHTGGGFQPVAIWNSGFSGTQDSLPNLCFVSAFCESCSEARFPSTLSKEPWVSILGQAPWQNRFRLCDRRHGNICDDLAIRTNPEDYEK